MTELTETALVPLAPAGGEVALPDELIERAKDYMKEALSERSRECYARWWRVFDSWCERHGRQALPASPGTIAGWLTCLADGTDTGRPLARASISQALAAIARAHRAANLPFDRKQRVISSTLSGINRVKAMTEVDRQAQPVMSADICDLLPMFGKKVIHFRNRALVLSGWSGALRRSELVGLDWESAGTGTGFVQVSELGIKITLLRSKASQDRAEIVVVPRADVPEASEALEAWAQRAGLKPGEPVFRACDNRNQIATERLTAHSVSRIVKRCMRDLACKRGKSIEEAKEFVRRYSGHSLRAGYATSAADADIPSLRIQKHCRHKSADMTARYVRISQAWTKSGLKGILNRATAPAAGAATEAQP